MIGLSLKQTSSREKTLLTALLLSAPGPLLTGIALMTSHSTTQLADFLRRGVELVAIFISWWVFRQLQRDVALGKPRQARLERAAGLSTAGAMACSGVVLLVVALSRLSAFQPGGSVIMGLTIAVLGLVTNGWFWRRYAAVTREQYSAVIAAQQQLYRAKASVDLCVVAALVPSRLHQPIQQLIMWTFSGPSQSQVTCCGAGCAWHKSSSLFPEYIFQSKYKNYNTTLTAMVICRIILIWS